ncbi:MAG: dynamin family protein [Pseudonocardiaceae bacterium]
MTGSWSGRWPGPLSAAVAQLCEQLERSVGPRTAAGLREVARRLAAPLQVALVGRLSSGKSTLVNALIGRRVARTDVAECTQLVTRFRNATVDRVEVVLRTGQRRALPFDAAGMIPAELEVDLAQVSHLEAYLTNAVLQDLTVLDTPGLGSLDAASAARAQAVLRPQAGLRPPALDDASTAAVAEAEAVLYVVTQAVRADDAEMLAAFTAATAARQAGPVNAIAVLTKADTVVPESVPGSDGDVVKAAALLAARQAEVLGPRVAGVLPMIGLLAETAETGALRTADTAALAALARTDPAIRTAMLLSTDLFTTLDSPVPATARRQLLERLDLYGVSRALDALAADPRLTTGALRTVLREVSGLDRLRARLDAVFRVRADGIKAAGALSSITALARASGDPRERRLVHDAVEVLRATPQAHQLQLLEAVILVSTGAVALPCDLADEVLRVGGSTVAAEQLGLAGRSRAELAYYAMARAGWWRSFASFGATPAQSRVAHVVHRAYFLLWQQLRDERGAGVRFS